jgi:phosphoribosylaminoimidazole-succinocarboxamide synthase
VNQLLYDGKAKSLYFIDGKDDEVLQAFKDSITAFNNPKPYIFEGKGVVTCQISSHVFKFLERNGIKTHLISSNDSATQVVQKLDILKIEITVRNYAFGNILKRSHFIKGEKLSEPLIEFMYKEDKFGDPLISEDYVLKYLLNNNEELFKEIKKLSFRINELLIEFFKAIDITLGDFKIEVGLNKDKELILADEISGDTCRLRDNLNNLLPLDKDLLREDIGNVLDGYKEILRRIKIKYSDL